MSEGWVKIHRKLLDNPVVCKDSEFLSVWIFLLLGATHKGYPVMFNGNKILLNPGQQVTCKKTISLKLKINESKIFRILKLFESEQQIEQQVTRHGRLVTLLNWEEYQKDERQNEQAMNDNRTTTEQQVTDNRTTSERQVNANKNVNNASNEKKVNNVNKKTIDFETLISDYTANEELIRTLNDFIEMRKSIKSPMTKRALELMLKNLTELSKGNDNIKIKILNNSIMSNWKGIFELKDEKTSKGPQCQSIADKMKEASRIMEERGYNPWEPENNY